MVTVNGDEADVIHEEVNVAAALLMWSQVQISSYNILVYNMTRMKCGRLLSN